jgi:hypothetical protein
MNDVTARFSNTSRPWLRNPYGLFHGGTISTTGGFREEDRSRGFSHYACVRCCINRVFCRRRSSGADVCTLAVPTEVIV